MRRIAPVLILLLAAAGGVAWYLGQPAPSTDVRASLNVADVLGGQADAGFDRAEAPRPFAFPADHGPHPDFRSEWWYFTGNLETPEGRPFGFQLTLFRTALAPPAQIPPRASAWAVNQVYMGHFALADIQAERFHAAEQLSRAAQGLAGATSEPFRVWLRSWSMATQEPQDQATDIWPLELRAETVDDATGKPEAGIRLVLEPIKPRVLQGQEGWSRKGPEPGNASYYYSYPRLAGKGTVLLANERLQVQGEVWMDREWSTSALSPDQVGWDWFALQLSDGRELMLYQLRRRDGTPDPSSSGTLIRRDGTTQPLTQAHFQLQVQETWTTPDGTATYPAAWQLTLPNENLDLTIRPRMANQELRLSVRYWEGAVEVRGREEDQPVAGHGYVELTGYAGGDVPK